MTLLRFDAQRRDRTRLKPAQRDRVAGLFAEAIGAVLDASQRRVDLRDQLPLAIASPQLHRAFRFRRSAVGEIRMRRRIRCQILQRLLCLANNFVFPSEQTLTEILPLALIHKGFGFRRPVIRR